VVRDIRRLATVRGTLGAERVGNLIGNGLATIAVAKWEGTFDEVLWRERPNARTPLCRGAMRIQASSEVEPAIDA
jgi:hypothetical protein